MKVFLRAAAVDWYLGTFAMTLIPLAMAADEFAKLGGLMVVTTGTPSGVACLY